MVIKITRQGGFANIEKSTIVDTKSLPVDKRLVVREELNKLTRNMAESSGYDRFTYLIKYDDEFGSHQLQRPERTVAPLLQAIS